MAAHCGCAIYVIAEDTIVLLLGARAFRAFLGGHELHAAFARGNAVFLANAITSFIRHWQRIGRRATCATGFCAPCRS